MRGWARPRHALLIIAFCFLARSAFYSVVYPIWEGYDEWAHYAVIERMALRAEALPNRQTLISQRVSESLNLAPVPWEMRAFSPPFLTQDDFWKLSSAEQHAREKSFAELPPQLASQNAGSSLRMYEALQPPLYGWLMSPFYLLTRNLDLGSSVILIRLAGCAFAVWTIPMVYQIARLTLGSEEVALGCAAIVAVMPEFCVDIARVGNECIAVTLFTALTWLALRAFYSGMTTRNAAMLGIVLGLGLLTKAYFLIAVPSLAAICYLVFRRFKQTAGEVIRRVSLIYLIAAGLSGWWYVRNIFTTGTLSGLDESIAIRSLSTLELMRRAWGIHVGTAIDTILFSHLWFGGWSSLHVRSLVYHGFYLVVFMAVIGLFRRHFRGLEAVFIIYGAFWLGELYNAELIYLSKGLSISMGWYMYAVVGAEVVLGWAGLRALLPDRFAPWIAPAGVTLFCGLDLDTVHLISIPYYTGMIQHRANGAIPAVHPANFASLGIAGTFSRLGAFKGPLGSVPVITAMWLLYLTATLIVLWLSFCWRSFKSGESS